MSGFPVQSCGVADDDDSGDRGSKSWDYAILGILVVVILVLIATGTVPIFDF